ncbi:MAG TPA: fasciclin domain-containing protein [Phycisphaerae bacterium]|nr:fasciclin domain-containing protein [Phycisphaerae bacterium]
MFDRTSRRAALGMGIASMAAVALGRPRIGFAQDMADEEDAMTVIAQDGRFAQWVTLIDAANLEQRTAHPRGAYTAFIPTDDAFEKYPYAVRNILGQNRAPAHSDPFSMENAYRAAFVVRTHVVPGLHPMSEFEGKKVTLTNLAGTAVIIDGTQAGGATVTWEYQGGLLKAGKGTAKISGAPLRANMALIYALDPIEFNTYG